MATLTFCLSPAQSNLPKEDKDYIRERSKEYQDTDKLSAADAHLKAVEDVLAEYTGEHRAIVDQVEKAGGAVPESWALSEKKPETPVEVKDEVAEEPIKKPVEKKPTEKAKKPLYSKKKSEPEAAEESFNKWKGGADVPVVEPEDVNDYVFKQNTPVVVKVFHGTTHKFDAFEAHRKGNMEGQFGAVNYFTSSEADATDNYAGEGPDLTIRIDQLTDQIEGRVEYESAEELAEEYGISQEKLEAAIEAEDLRQIAVDKLAGGEDQTLELFVKVENPFVIGENAEWIEFVDNEAIELDAAEQVADENDVSMEEAREEYEDEISERRWEIEAETPNELVEAILTVSNRHGVEAQNLASEIYDLGGEAKPEDIEQLLRASEDYAYAEGEEGGLIGSQLVAEVIEEMGFDSIILRNAESRFENMDIEYGTAHVHIFDSNNTNIKSTENIGTFDPADPRILYKKGEKAKPQSTTKQLTDALLAGKFKKPVKKLIDQGKLKIVQSESDLPKSIDPLGTAGAFVGEENKIYFVADNVATEEAESLLKHEGFHGASKDVLGQYQYDKMITRLKRLDKMKGEVAEWFVNARAAVPSDTPSEHIYDEIAAYAVEQHRDTPKKQPKSISDFVKSIIVAFKRGMVKLGVLPKDFTAEDLSIISQSSLKRFAETDKTSDAAPVYSKRKPEVSEYTKQEQEAIDVGGFGVRKVSSSKEAYEKLKDRFKTKMRQGIVDQYASIKEILKSDRAWMMAHLSHASTGGLEAVMQFGQPKLTDGALDVDINKKSLQDILEPLGKDMDRFFMWMVGHRAAKLKAEDRERLFSDANIKALQGMDKTSSVGTEVFESVRKDFEEMGNAINKIAVETGLVSKKEAESWAEESFYVPFYRMLEGEARGPRIFADQITKQTAYKKLKGADLQLDDPLTNVLLNWNHLLAASMKNQAAVSAVEAAVKMGLAKVVTAKKKSKNAIWVRWDGKQVWVDIEEGTDGALVLDSLMSLNYDGMNNLAMKTLRTFKRALTIGVTLSPEFRIANLMRDSIHSIAVVGDKGMSTNIGKNVLNGWEDTKKGSPLHARMIASGGAFGDSGYIHGADPEAIKHVVSKGAKRDTILDARWRITKMFDAYQDFGSRMENVNRAAQFEKKLKDGDLLEAAFSSRDLLDFSRTGAFPAVRFLTSSVPFLNARLQGLDKMGRAAMTKGERQRFFTVTAMYSLASVALYLAMKDDEDYKASEEWEKDAYHLFKIPGSDVMYRLPRPFEVGAIANLAERAVEQVVNDDVHGELFAERLWHTINHTFAFNPMPQAFMPALEVFANKSTFTGRPIESQSMENLPAADRKRAWTSETAIAMSKGMDDISWGKVVLSPVQIQHLVNGYLGWAGSQTLAATDMLVTRPAIGAPERPSKKLTEYPILKRFMRETPSRNTKYTTKFYEDLQEIRLAYNSVRQAKKLKELDKAIALKKEHKEKLKWRKAYGAAQRQLSKLNRRIEMIHRSMKTPEAKRKEIDRLIERRNAITKRVTERADIR